MASINLASSINKAANISAPEEMLGKGILMPFNASNSGSRKLMFGTHLEQRLPLVHPETPYVQTGYEKQFGKASSSYITTDRNYRVVAKIPKFSFSARNHYYLILASEDDAYLDVVERVEYYHISESYGYCYNNDYMDGLLIGDAIPAGVAIKKSIGFDDDDNRQDGRNLLAVYMANERTMEDGIVISETASKALSSPLVKKVEIQINDNDIPLNLYGDENNYKIFPDVGEECKNGLLCALRREKKQETLYLQSYNRLRELIISDDKYIGTGRVVDVNIYVNNPEMLNIHSYNSQLKKYQEEKLAMCHAVIEEVDRYLAGNPGLQMSYELQRLYTDSKAVLSGKQYHSGAKIFSNIILEVVILEEIPVSVGDKLTNRYGGKGVVTYIEKDELMPKTADGRTVHIKINMNGVSGRENPGQLFELSVTAVAHSILNAISTTEFMDIGDCIDSVLRFLRIVAPGEYEFFAKKLSMMSDDDAIMFINSFTDYESIYTICNPMSENMTIDKISQLYDEFPYAVPERLFIPMEDSKGVIKYAPSRRAIVAGYIYIYRLKQYAEEKFSVTSLSSTNVRNENSRNKLANAYRAPFTRTPIRFGDMETGDLMHLGPELIIQILMLYSSSPHGRRLAESMMTGDPFNIDVKLDDESSNRNAEILAVYLKAKGFRLVFTKKLKQKIVAFEVQPMAFFGPPKITSTADMPYPMYLGDPNFAKFDSTIAEAQYDAEKKAEKTPFEVYPMEFFGPEKIKFTLK